MEIIAKIFLIIAWVLPPLLVISFIMNLVRVYNERKDAKHTLAAENTAAEIERLYLLKEKGALTQQEFADRKSGLLRQ